MNYKDLCALLERTHHVDIERHCDNLEQHLTEVPLEEVRVFHRTLTSVLSWLDTHELRTAYALIHGGIWESDFVAFRARLMLAGRAVFEDAATNPEALLVLADSGPWRCTRLLELAPDVHRERTGIELTGNGLESRGHDVIPDGYFEQWQERYPRFWARYPWALGIDGGRRERHFVSEAQRQVTPSTANTIVGYAFGGAVVTVALLFVGRWLGASMVLLATLAGAMWAGFRTPGILRAQFIRECRPDDGRALVGPIRYRLVRLTVMGGSMPIRPPAIDEGFAILRSEAQRYGKALTFVEDGTPVSLATSPDLELSDAVERAQARIDAIADELAQQDGPSFVLVVANTGNGAYASRDCRIACVSHSYPGGTFAHEILHLFGALDLYEHPTLQHLRPQAKRRMAELLFDFDPETVSIMRHSRDEHACVDPFTAATVGWIDIPARVSSRLPDPSRTADARSPEADSEDRPSDYRAPVR
ncbi:MAG: DUF4240 domain-containing protein [Deltaproteobacteria bacterium]|nr:DUF4240 domain-containing protein [Deltaproteobacteria bacterium]